MDIRDAFFDNLYVQFTENNKNIILTADNGAPSLDKFAIELKNQYYNVGIAEQFMIGLASGLASENRNIYCYAISPFITSRVYEQIKIDICAMNLPITLIGSGVGYSYPTAGLTHQAVEDFGIMRILPNLKIYHPTNSKIAGMLPSILSKDQSPAYIRLEKSTTDIDINNINEIDIINGYTLHGNLTSYDYCIICTGTLLEIALELTTKINTIIINIFRLKPLGINMLEIISKAKEIITIEEHQLNCGLGSSILETISDHKLNKIVHRFGIPNVFMYHSYTKTSILNVNNINTESILQVIKGE